MRRFSHVEIIFILTLLIMTISIKILLSSMYSTYVDNPYSLVVMTFNVKRPLYFLWFPLYLYISPLSITAFAPILLHRHFIFLLKYFRQCLSPLLR